MENYADYTFYTSVYDGSLSSDLFNHFIIEASRIIEDNVNRKLTTEVLNSLDSDELNRLKYCACQLCDYLQVNGTASSTSSKSVSIDGVSISGGTDSEQISKNNLNTILNRLPHELTRDL